MFDSNEMRELAAIKAYRYERAGGGGAHKVYNTSKAYDDARGYSQMSSWDQLVYRTTTLWRQAGKASQIRFQMGLPRSNPGYGQWRDSILKMAPTASRKRYCLARKG